MSQAAFIDPQSLHSRDQMEIIIQKRLEKETGGKHVSCPAGIADIVTDRELIEIKRWKDWKSGLGQLFAYAVYFPNRRLRLHLFGELHGDGVSAIYKCCGAYGISISSEDSLSTRAPARSNIPEVKQKRSQFPIPAASISSTSLSPPSSSTLNSQQLVSINLHSNNSNERKENHSLQ